MPTQTTVDRFVNMVESGRGLQAMVDFYAEEATMQENFGEQRVGKQALLKHEQAALAAVENMNVACVQPILIAGDTVVIRWVFEYDSKGRRVRFEELAYQRWQGEKIIEEQFFYDPAQFK